MTKENTFFKVGDGRRASELYPVGSKYVTLHAFAGIPTGTVGEVVSVDDGGHESDGSDDTEIKINFENGRRGYFTSEMMADSLQPVEGAGMK